MNEGASEFDYDKIKKILIYILTFQLQTNNTECFFVYLINLCKTVNTADMTVEFKEENEKCARNILNDDSCNILKLRRNAEKLVMSKC
jgi:hypothetical protein